MSDNHDSDTKSSRQRAKYDQRKQEENDSSGASGASPYFQDLSHNREEHEFDQNEELEDSETTNSDLERSLIKKKRQSNQTDNSNQTLKSNLKSDRNRQSNHSSNKQPCNEREESNRSSGQQSKQMTTAKRLSMENMQRIRQRQDTPSPNPNNHKIDTRVTFRHKEGADPKKLLHNPVSSQSSSGYVSEKNEKFDIWGAILTGISYFFLVVTMPLSLFTCIKVSQEFERAVIFRLGRVLEGDEKGPGIFFVLPCIDSYVKVDLRTVTFDVPPQEILTKDSVTVSVDAVVYFRIFSAVVSVINVEDAAKSTKLLSASTLRNILGTKSLHEILSDRESIACSIQSTLDDATEPWGVKVERVEVKDVRLPVQLQRAMAAEAEATREARAKVIAAEGENKASGALKRAAEVISESPIAIQLRYLQTLTAIASERNSTIVFPVPLEMLSFLADKSSGPKILK